MRKSLRLLVSAVLAVSASVSFGQGGEDISVRINAATKKYKEGNLLGSIRDFEVLRQESMENIDVARWLGFLYLRDKQAQKAIPLLEQAANAKPNDLEILNNLGNAYYLAGNKAKALAKYQMLADLSKENKLFEPYYNMGNIYLSNKDYARAVAAYSTANSLQPNNVNVLNNMGVALEGDKQIAKASDFFVRASDIDPKNPVFARNAGGSLFRSGKKSAAKTYLSRALANGSKDRDVILALGDCLMDAKDSSGLNSLYSQHADVFASDFKFQYNLGVLRRKQGDKAGAIEAFTKANSLNDSDADTLSNLGVLRFNAGDYSGAKDAFEALVRMNPTLSNKKNFAAAAARSGDLSSAVPIWQAIVRANPSDYEVRMLLADTYYERGDIKTAMSHFKAVQKAKPNSAMALDGVGRCHLADANYVAAEAALRAAIDSDARYVPAYNNLAVVLEKLNRRAQAVALLEKALTIDANNEDVQRNLKRMKSVG